MAEDRKTSYIVIGQATWSATIRDVHNNSEAIEEFQDLYPIDVPESATVQYTVQRDISLPDEDEKKAS